jgi:hypothetical protein
MLISHQYGFIFIKTMKTGGTSIEVDLSRIMGPADVVTEIFPAEEGHVPRNFILNGSPMVNHVPAAKVREALGPDLFGRYFKFCVEREPIDKCLSHFYMLKNSPMHQAGYETLTWEQYIAAGEFPVDHEKYLDLNGDLLVDRILHYERLDQELGDLMAELRVPFSGLKARAKSGFRTDGLTPGNVSPEQHAIVLRAFERSFPFTTYGCSAP